jgi:hypothetical protein
MDQENSFLHFSCQRYIRKALHHFLPFSVETLQSITQTNNILHTEDCQREKTKKCSLPQKKRGIFIYSLVLRSSKNLSLLYNISPFVSSSYFFLSLVILSSQKSFPTSLIHLNLGLLTFLLPPGLVSKKIFLTTF